MIGKQRLLARKQLNKNARFIILVIGTFWLTLGFSVMIFSLLERWLFSFNLAHSIELAAVLAIMVGSALIFCVRK